MPFKNNPLAAPGSPRFNAWYANKRRRSRVSEGDAAEGRIAGVEVAVIGTSAPLTVTNPSTGPDQLIVVVYVTGNDATNLGLDTGPAGFTVVPGLTGGANRDDRLSYAHASSNDATGSDFTFTEDSGVGRGVLAAVAINGIDLANRFASQDQLTTGSGTSITIPASSVAGDFHLGFLGVYAGWAPTSSPSSEIINESYSGIGDDTRLLGGAQEANDGFTWGFGSTRFAGRLALALNAV